ncbi:MAG: hypothetical protein ACD_46C00085G0005 [uncultured bacterium]|nr:MAG: hypothetical protein ACD_46C00085G0005 [uncultured bacterium]
MDNNAEFRIIVIDDNLAIHHDFMKILAATDSTSNHLNDLSEKMFGKHNEENILPKFQIDTASQGQEGVERIKYAIENNHPYSVAFVDIRMPPGWDGIETIKHIWELDKDIQVVICTAYSDYSWEETVSYLGKTDNLLILKKPFDNVSVRQLACALTKKWQLLQETRKFTASLKKQIEDRTTSLQQSLSLIKATLESTDEGIIVISNEGRIIEYNQKFCGMWNVPKDIIDSKYIDKLEKYMQKQLIDPSDFVTWLKAMKRKPDLISIDILKFKDGRVFDCYSRPQILNADVVGRVLNFRDITDRVKLEDELNYQANHDSLTGLPNRVKLLKKLHDAIAMAEANHSMFAVFFIDLDRFKLINDSLSHAAGDELLRATGNRLQAVMRSEDTLARLGGDEFIILLANMKSNDAILEKASLFLRLFQKPFKIANRNITVTASIGISIYPNNGKTVDALLKNSDSAMYNVKESGTNNFQIYSEEMNEKSLEKLDEEMQLRNALMNNELFLSYQPQYDIANNKLIAVEALLRWNHPEKGILFPLDFVPLAEETGQILSIGEWVIRTACLQSIKWQKEGLPPIRVAVNITLQQLKQHNCVGMIKAILKETALQPELLEIELTENSIISNAEVIKTVIELKSLGVIITVDDFGTGYSSLTYLKKIPLDRLKIDSSFIQNIQATNDDKAIVRAIIAVAKNLHIEVLAEGVETENQANFLKKQKCDEIQGYYFSKPLSENQVRELLKKSKKEPITS